MLGTTTVASLVAQLSFDEKDEVEIVDLYMAWDKPGREEMRQKQVASVGIMGRLERVLGRLT
jgi:predicted ATP-dependent Lon-type protease